MTGQAPRRLTIIGGGIAGLAAGYFARKRGLPFEIHEAAGRPGGNCVTFRHGDFAFDSGAHRLHDRKAEITAELKGLLGEKLSEIFVPSQIYHRGRYVDFPLSPLNLASSLGPAALVRVGAEVIGSRLESRRGGAGDFESYAVRKYGRTLASLFLLNYSEKLWGIPGLDLYQEASSNRLEGLTLGTFVKEAVFGKRAKTRHLDGSFYYPDDGIGAIPEALAGFLGPGRIRLGSRAMKVLHDGSRIRAVAFDGAGTVPVDGVLSTIPVTDLLRALDPAPPGEVRAAAKSLRFRHVRLVALFLRKNRVTGNATVYFPSKDFPFTRIYEPSNRSPRMSPEGHTSIVAEIPFDEGESDPGTGAEDEAREFAAILARIGWIREDEIVGSAVHTLPQAYPVLSVEAEKNRAAVFDFLDAFENLRLVGRGSRFRYVHIHHLMAGAREAINSWFPVTDREAQEPERPAP